MLHAVCLAEVHETMLQQPPHVGEIIMQSATACTTAVLCPSASEATAILTQMSLRR